MIKSTNIKALKMLQSMKYIVVLILIISSNYITAQETIDLFILAGQSNAQGWKADGAFYPEDVDSLDSQIRLNATFIDHTSLEGWVTMQAQPERYTNGHFGPEVTFSRKLKQAGLNPAIFKYTIGGSDLYAEWKQPGAGGYYDAMVADLIPAISELESQGHTVNVKAFIWIQGESDATVSTYSAAYKDNLTLLINDLRSNVIKDNSLPIILGVDDVNGFDVLVAQQEIAASDNNIIWTSMLGLPKADNTHLTPIGVMAHGEVIFADYEAAIFQYDENVVPGIIECENFDYYLYKGEGLIYHDNDTINSGGKYRLGEGVDIDTCSEGGYQLSSLENGEWVNYTINVPVSSLYNISLRYASANANGKVKLSLDGKDITNEVVMPFGDIHSTGLNDWKDYTIATDLLLLKGVQTMTLSISGDSASFVLNSISVEEGASHSCENSLPFVNPSSRKEQGIYYKYYEGVWDSLPDFETLTPLQEGITDSIKLIDGLSVDSFALVFDGYINIPINGNYTFYTVSGEGSRLLIDGVEIVDNDDLHGAIEQSGDICLDEGFHEIRVEYFEKAGDEELVVMYAGPGISKQVLSDFNTVSPCPNKALEDLDDLLTGLTYNYYIGTWDSLPDFNLLTPKDSGLTSSVSANFGTKSESYGLTFDGYILISDDGDYTFYTSSDDGSRLLIDDMEIVQNDGLHGAVTQSGTLCLEAGYHKISIEYFQATGGKSMSAAFEGPGFTKRSLTDLYSLPIPDKTGQAVTLATNGKVQVYPNPVSDMLTIKLQDLDDANLEIINAIGKIVLLQNIKSQEVSINLSEIEDGVYILKISQNGYTSYKRIIKC